MKTLILSMMIFLGTLQVGAENFRLMLHPVSKINTETLKFSEDNVSFVGISVYSSGCYNQESNFVYVDHEKKQLILNHLVRFYEGLCVMALKFNKNLFKFLRPIEGKYIVKDQVTDFILGLLVINEEKIWFEINEGNLNREVDNDYF